MGCKLACVDSADNCYACDATKTACGACNNGFSYNAKTFSCVASSETACKTGDDFPAYFFGSDTCAECD